MRLFSLHSLWLLLFTALTVSACVRVLSETYEITVDGVSYEVRVYGYPGLPTELDRTFVVLDGREYTCAPDPTDPPDCAAVVRAYVRNQASEPELPRLTDTDLNRRSGIIPGDGQSGGPGGGGGGYSPPSGGGT